MQPIQHKNGYSAPQSVGGTRMHTLQLAGIVHAINNNKKLLLCMHAELQATASLVSQAPRSPDCPAPTF